MYLRLDFGHEIEQKYTYQVVSQHDMHTLAALILMWLCLMLSCTGLVSDCWPFGRPGRLHRADDGHNHTDHHQLYC
jgi:hypothetical protein